MLELKCLSCDLYKIESILYMQEYDAPPKDFEMLIVYVLDTKETYHYGINLVEMNDREFYTFVCLD